MSDSRIRAVIFDLGKVLIDFDWERALARLAPRTPLPRAKIIEAALTSGLIEPYEEGRMEDAEFLQRLARSFGADIAPAELAEIWTDIFVRRPEMELLFASTRARVPVGILSDTSSLHWEYIRAFAPALSQPDGLVLSYKVGSRKPALRNFQLAAASVQTPAEECLYFDDRPENVAGAVAAGLQAFVYQSPEDTREKIFSRLA